MSGTRRRIKPDFGLFTAMLGILLAVLIPVLQMNGLELNWQWSLVAYMVITVGVVWTYLSHAVPHCGSTFKKISSLFIVVGLAWPMWMATHNQYLKQHPKTPMLTIVVATLPGMPENFSYDPRLKYHQIQIANYSGTEIDNFRARLQLPEPIKTNLEIVSSPGMSIEWRPLLTKFTVTGVGNHKFLGPQSMLHQALPQFLSMPWDNAAQLTRISDSGDMTGVWELEIDKLPPGSQSEISFITTDEGDATNYISLANYEFKTNGGTVAVSLQGTTNGGVLLHDLTMAMIVQTNASISNQDWHLGTNELRFSLDGWYDYTARDKLQSLHFLVPFIFDPTNRALSSRPIQVGTANWKLVRMEYQ